MTNPFGRPPKYDLIEQAKAITEWSKKDDATALCQFCDQQDVSPTYIYEWRDKSPDFSEALKKAQNRLAIRLRSLLHHAPKGKEKYNYGLFMAELGSHDKFYHDYQEGLKDRASERSKAIENTKQTTYNIMVPHGLAIGSNVSASPVSTEPDQSSK